MMWEQGWRDQLWSDLDQQWDIIIVGGGITGAGILREAVRAGNRTLLIEGQDFAAGTSSRSSKLVHGGLRYLRNGQIMTTISSVHERERLLKEGPGLVSPLGFLYACFEGQRLAMMALGLGLALYDLLGLRRGHKRYDPASLAAMAPGIRQSDLLGGYRYFDAQTDDARLVIRIIRESVRAGGRAINYVQARSVLRQADGRVCGVAVEDVADPENRRSAEIFAPIVINATGAWADQLRTQMGSKARLRCLRGSHLVFPSKGFPLSRAVCFSHPFDGRPMFALPWEGVTLFGTTDVDNQGLRSAEPSITAAELDYLMDAVRYGFPGLSLEEEDIQATFSGVRAVVNTGKSNPSKESREHVLWNEDGLLTVTGGKLTTFRVMARDALKAAKRGGANRLRLRSTPTLDPAVEIGPSSDLDPYLRRRLAGRYGYDALDLIAAASATDMTTIDATLGRTALWAELRWAARAEGVVHLEDLLLRRLRLGLLLPDGGMQHMDAIRAVAQAELGWDDRRWRAEEQAYAHAWRQSHAPPGNDGRENEQRPDRVEQDRASSPDDVVAQERATHPA